LVRSSIGPLGQSLPQLYQTKRERPTNDACDRHDVIGISSNHQHVAVRQTSRDLADSSKSFSVGPARNYLTGPGEGEEAGSARQRARRNKKMGYCSPFEAGERMSVAGSRHLPGVSASKIFIVWRAKIMLRNTHLITVK
jgi:hypothetical protein